MGGGDYDYEEARSHRTSTPVAEQFTFRGSTSGSSQKGVHPDLNIHGKIRECFGSIPIVVALDVTRSRGRDTHLVYQHLPDFLHEIERQRYISKPEISFCAVGDVSADKAPIQISQFEADNRLDRHLQKFWIEEGGGGTGQESYELAAYYYARRTTIPSVGGGQKGYFFFLGDEAPYSEVRRDQIISVCGHDPQCSYSSAQIFQELQAKFHTFLVYPQKTMAERRADIDEEIRQRVVQAGGRHEGVDIRASLIWNNRNDLDLHVLTPSGEHIYYGSKRSRCGGWLDVDMNVRGETTKPVENVQWIKGSAPTGKYTVYVENYQFHEGTRGPTNFKLELEVGGQIRSFEGTIANKGEIGTPSRITVFEFDYLPSDNGSKYDAYDDENILGQWRQYLPASHILRVDRPEAIVDTMLGVLSITGGRRSMSQFQRELQSRTHQMRPEQAPMILGGLESAWLGAAR